MNSRKINIILYAVLCLTLFVSCKGRVKNDSRYADGLVRTTPESQGVPSEAILNFIEAAEQQNLELHSFMILRHGKVISEGWWYPYSANINHLMHSVSKTFTSTAVGFAVSEGLLTVDDPVISFFPDDLPEEINPNLRKLTIKHLLTMSEGNETAPTFYISDKNWVRSFLDTWFPIEPGSRFVYSSYATYMVSAILQKVTGMSVYDYLTPRLFEPLNIKDIQWETDANGINTGGWGMRIKTIDMAKLGQFYLQKGKWNNEQLLPAAWIEEAASPQIWQRPDLSEEERAGDDWTQGYGYQIWMCTNNAYRADGARGQFIVVMPDQDMVVIMTANIGDTKAELKLIWDHLLPSLSDKSLKSDPDAQEWLNSKIVSLQLPDPFRADEDLPRVKDETRSYKMAENELNISNVTFAFQSDGSCIFTLATDKASYDLAFGPDMWSYGTTDKLSPYFLSPRRNPNGLLPLTVAGYGSWTAKDNYQLRLLYVTDADHETYSCRFDGDKVVIEVSNSAQSNEKPIVLNGSKIA